ncbi:Protein E7 [Clarias magur]|uniref:Protein E7 n=1 Tax=Clarias magur TaxID=1594786 RepID=A0A8J4WY68_CLAMG|nr:Protein E7 [Clarias magur]
MVPRDRLFQVVDCQCSIMHCESGWMKRPDGTNADCRLCSNGCMETKSFSRRICGPADIRHLQELFFTNVTLG